MTETLRNIFRRAYVETRKASARWIVRVEIIVLTILGLLFLWLVRGWATMKDELWITALCLFAPSAASVLFLFCWNLSRAPSRIRDDAFNEVRGTLRQKTAEISGLRAEIAELASKVAESENKIELMVHRLKYGERAFKALRAVPQQEDVRHLLTMLHSARDSYNIAGAKIPSDPDDYREWARDRFGRFAHIFERVADCLREIENIDLDVLRKHRERAEEIVKADVKYRNEPVELPLTSNGKAEWNLFVIRLNMTIGFVHSVLNQLEKDKHLSS